VEQDAPGEVERAGPGDGGAQATCSVGTLQGLGRRSPPTCIAPYRTVAFAQLYERQTARTAAALLTDPVGPCFATPAGPLSWRLTDRGTEDGGSPASHAYEVAVAVEHIAHPRPKGKSPQPKGRGERWPQTRLTECSRLPLRKKLSCPRAEFPADLDSWLTEDNEERGHQGRGCYGRTPLRTFLDTIPLAEEKLLAA
jgi:hypothetical protein